MAMNAVMDGNRTISSAKRSLTSRGLPRAAKKNTTTAEIMKAAAEAVRFVVGDLNRPVGTGSIVLLALTEARERIVERRRAILRFTIHLLRQGVHNLLDVPRLGELEEHLLEG